MYSEPGCLFLFFLGRDQGAVTAPREGERDRGRERATCWLVVPVCLSNRARAGAGREAGVGILRGKKERKKQTDTGRKTGQVQRRAYRVAASVRPRVCVCVLKKKREEAQ